MDHGFRRMMLRVVFRFAVFLCLMCLLLLFVVKVRSAEFVVLILTLGLNITLITIISVWLRSMSKQDAQDDEDEG
ncbi:MAG: hypothetical protein K6T83_05240 [Alicyclobacillus sp.]|nr:hypothetical protein [Alicyclobacillus sp.]